jgi:tetratricopeptide (TPR) repeat protein
MQRLLAAVLLCIAAEAAASPQSDALVRRGVAELDAARYRDAIHFFGEAVKADPQDLRAVFLQAVALNRLGNYREAYLLIRGIENQGAKHAELDFEAGWALMGLGRAGECVERLERFEQASPGRGQTSEFLGRCHLQLGERERAEAHFRLAVERDPRLKGSADFRAGRIADAAATDTPTGRALRNVLGLPEPIFQPDKPLALSASLTIGRNDNVIGLGNTIPLPTDISNKAANFLRANLHGAYTRVLPTRSAATLGYALLVERYDDLSAANVSDHFVYADLFHAVRGRIGASVRFSHQLTELAGDKFRDQSGLRPALSYRFSENSVSELAWSYAVADYHSAASGPFDRDGHAKSLTATHSLRIPRSAWSASLSAAHLRNRAEGGDFSFDANSVSASLGYDIVRLASASLGVSYARHDYLNPNSLAGSGFSFARDDKQTAVSAQLAGPLSRGLRWFLLAQIFRSESNVAFYDFKQNVLSGGVGANF